MAFHAFLDVEVLDVAVCSETLVVNSGVVDWVPNTLGGVTVDVWELERNDGRTSVPILVTLEAENHDTLPEATELAVVEVGREALIARGSVGRRAQSHLVVCYSDNLPVSTTKDAMVVETRADDLDVI